MTGNPGVNESALGSELVTGSAVYSRLVTDLDAMGARYRMIYHALEGRTELVSALRGNPVAQAAKCLVVMIKVGKKQTRYVLAVVPGDARLDFTMIKELLEGTYVTLASSTKVEGLAGSPVGTVLPVSYHSSLELIADPTLLEMPELYFNAARLDRSIALNTEDYQRLADPRVEPIIATRE